MFLNVPKTDQEFTSMWAVKTGLSEATNTKDGLVEGNLQSKGFSSQLSSLI
jgi:hypothetical protein